MHARHAGVALLRHPGTATIHLTEFGTGRLDGSTRDESAIPLDRVALRRVSRRETRSLDTRRDCCNVGQASNCSTDRCNVGQASNRSRPLQHTASGELAAPRWSGASEICAAAMELVRDLHWGGRVAGCFLVGALLHQETWDRGRRRRSASG